MTTILSDQVTIEEREQTVALIFRCKSRDETQRLYESLKAEMAAGGMSLKLETETTE